jgi:hypothetical protein
MNAIRAKLREATNRRFVGHSLAWIVGNLNRVLRGWGAYFRLFSPIRGWFEKAYVTARRSLSTVPAA